METKIYRKLQEALDFCYYVKHLDISHIQVSCKDSITKNSFTRQRS